MSKLLGKLINAIEPIFSHGISRLEKSTGNGGIDTKMMADVIEHSHTIMRKLGLDPADTTGPELYASLRAYVVNNNFQGDLLDQSDYILIMIDDVLISFNIIDIIENMHHELDFKHGIVSHAQRSLKGELVSRYINHMASNEKTVMDISESIGLLSASNMV